MVLASCAQLPEGDGDEAELVEVLAERGIRARWAPWGGPVDSDELVVLRASWDYTDHRAEFLDWCASLPALVNPYQVVRRNTDKRYLARFAETGLAVVPTVVHEVGAKLDPVWDQFVVKPAVGAGSRDAGRFTAETIESARAHLRALHDRGTTVISQPYQHAVDIEGETSLVFFRGAYSHAFTKGPMLRTGQPPWRGTDGSDNPYLEERLGSAEPDAAMVALGRDCLAVGAADAGVTVEDVVYARVDLVRGADGPMLLELELTEPGLGFRHTGPEAMHRFADAIASASRSQ